MVRTQKQRDNRALSKQRDSHYNFLFFSYFACAVFENLESGPVYIDSDTGLESMSSAEATTKACSVCLEDASKSANGDDGAGGSAGGSVSPDTMMIGSSSGVLSVAEAALQIDGLTQEVTQLKNDKLHLLQENVVSVDALTPPISHLGSDINHDCDFSRNVKARSSCAASTSNLCRAIWWPLARRYCDCANCSRSTCRR